MQSIIEEFKILPCGSCENNLKHLFKGEKNKPFVFPANVFYIKHRVHGGILFDTGYSNLVFNNGALSKLYQRFNPATVGENDIIVNKINEIVNSIIISHAHPDHIGGALYYPKAEFIMSKEVFETIRKPKIRDVVFKNMAEHIKNPKILKNPVYVKGLSEIFGEVFDVFSDGSILAVNLEGHSKGQIGLFIPEINVFLGADSCWNESFLLKTDDMKFIPRLVQNNFKEYEKTTNKIIQFSKNNPNVKIYFSHSKIESNTTC